MRDFLFTNPAHFFGEANPNFFKGTTVEDATQRALVTRWRISGCVKMRIPMTV